MQPTDVSKTTTHVRAHVTVFRVENVPSFGVRHLILHWEDAEGIPQRLKLSEFGALNLEGALRHWRETQ